MELIDYGEKKKSLRQTDKERERESMQAKVKTKGQDCE